MTRTNEAAATGVGHRRRPRFNRQVHDSTQTRSRQVRAAALDDLGLNVADATEHAERCVLTELWLSPNRSYAACVEARLTGAHFARSVHSFLYCYFCRCSESNAMPEIGECLECARRAGIWLGRDYLDANDESAYLREIIRDTPTNPDHALHYAECVVGFAKNRERVARAFGQYAYLVGDGRFKVVTLLEPRHGR